MKQKANKQPKSDRKNLSLTVKERVILCEMINVLYQKNGSLMEMLSYKHILQKTEFSSEEMEVLKFENVRKEIGEKEVSFLKWDFEKGQEMNRNIEFTQLELSTIDSAFKKQGAGDNSMTSAHVDLYLKFEFDLPA